MDADDAPPAGVLAAGVNVWGRVVDKDSRRLNSARVACSCAGLTAHVTKQNATMPARLAITIAMTAPGARGCELGLEPRLGRALELGLETRLGRGLELGLEPRGRGLGLLRLRQGGREPWTTPPGLHTTGRPWLRSLKLLAHV